jgi:hypothetical protein
MTVSRGVFLFCGSVIALLLAARGGFGFDTYPWLFPDSYDWLTNGLAYSGLVADLSISHRAMLLPLLTSILLRVGLESVVPLIGTFAFAALLLISFRSLTALVSRELGTLSAVLLACSSPLLFQSGFVGSDVLAVLCLTGLNLSYLKYLNSNARQPLVTAALWAALGVHAQYIEVIWLPFLLVGLGVESRDGGIGFSFAQLKRRAVSRDMALACLCGVTVAALILLPRLLKYGIVYAPHVVHLPLVSPSSRNIFPYLVGFTGQLSWPVAMMALTGACFGFRQRETQTLSLLCAGWITVIGGFFVVFYSWFDIRFVIYITVPTIILAAVGIIEMSRSLSKRLRRDSPALRGSITAAFTMAVCGAAVLRPNANVFSGELLITPRHAFLAPVSGGASFRKVSEPDVSLLQVLNESNAARASDRPDTLMHAPRLRRLFDSLPRDGEPVTFMGELSSDQTYFVRNRNILYRYGDVTTVSSVADGIRVVRENPSGMIVADRAALESIMQDLPAEVIVSRIDPYIAVRKEVARARLRTFPAEISSVAAEEHPYALFDGVLDRADNFTATPLGQTIRITFSRPRSVARLVVHLYDFDSRRYRFTVRAPQGDKSATWYESPAEGDLGTIEIPTPSQPVPYVEIVGVSNSDTERNPANRVLHIKEMGIKYND